MTGFQPSRWSLGKTEPLTPTRKKPGKTPDKDYLQIIDVPSLVLSQHEVNRVAFTLVTTVLDGGRVALRCLKPVIDLRPAP